MTIPEVLRSSLLQLAGTSLFILWIVGATMNEIRNSSINKGFPLRELMYLSFCLILRFYRLRKEY